MIERLRKYSKADFSFAEYPFKNIICILDSDLGSKSVTNDIENVVMDICLIKKIPDPNTYQWLWCGSDHEWAVWENKTETIVVLGIRGNPEEAITAMENYYKSQAN